MDKTKIRITGDESEVKMVLRLLQPVAGREGKINRDNKGARVYVDVDPTKLRHVLRDNKCSGELNVLNGAVVYGKIK